MIKKCKHCGYLHGCHKENCPTVTGFPKPKKCIYCEKTISQKNNSGMCESCSGKTSNSKNKLKTFKQRLERAREFYGK